MSLNSLWVHRVPVKTKIGDTSYGEKYAASVDVDCYIEDETKLVRDTSGSEVVSNSSLFADIDAASIFTQGSLVTLRRGDVRVISIAYLDAGPLAPGFEHLEVHLT